MVVARASSSRMQRLSFLSSCHRYTSDASQLRGAAIIPEARSHYSLLVVAQPRALRGLRGRGSERVQLREVVTNCDHLSCLRSQVVTSKSRVRVRVQGHNL